MTTEIELKMCNSCEAVKPLTEFYRSTNGTADGYEGQCKGCKTAARRRRRHAEYALRDRWRKAMGDIFSPRN